MTSDQYTRKAQLQRELILLRKASWSYFTPENQRDTVNRRITENLEELLEIDPNAATYENLGYSPV